MICTRCKHEFEPIDDAFKVCDPCYVQVMLDHKRGHKSVNSAKDYKIKAAGDGRE